EDDLVGDALQGERRVQQAGAGQQMAPPGPHHRAQGRHRAPAEPPVTNSAHTGARVSALKANAAVVTVNTVTSGHSTRACPQRSVSRAARGVTTTYSSAPTVDTAPATAYEPVTAITSMTWARLSMPIGSRPMIPGIANGSAPGTRRASR